MASWKRLLVFGGVLLGLTAGAALAQSVRRQYYTTWTYYERTYYYRTYYYKVTPEQPTYNYHYVIYYPTQPRYYYYYNPHRKLYWGRYDAEAKGYSLLDEKDRKTQLKDIPEEAFPKPAQLPLIPDAKDGVQIEAPPNDPPKESPAK